ncbi:twin-arginine translocation signal domain-containing protein, partial [Salmonella enterica]|nr:twin-arginine translocation signal domain-containing protein [Salmonella enterica]
MKLSRRSFMKANAAAAA